MSAGRAIQAALRGGGRLTVAQLVAVTRASENAVNSALRTGRWAVCVGVLKANGGSNGGGRNAKIWAAHGVAPEYVAPGRELLGPEGPGRGEIRDTEGVSASVSDDETSRELPCQGGESQWVRFEASAETAECPTSGTVKLADCIDGYVDATACERGTPCDGCAIGRARRAAWAGADFEDTPDEVELDA